MTQADGASADDFDRIVEGLELDLSGLEDFDAAAERIAAEREQETPAELAEPDEFDEFDPPEPRDEQFYRQVEPARLPADGRARAAWLVLVGGPAALLLASLASVHVAPALIAVVVIAAVAAVVYLIARLPDRGPSNPDWPDDGAAL